MELSKSVADVIQENEKWLRLAIFLHEPLKYGLLSVLHNTSNDPTYVGLSVNPLQLYQEFTKHGNLIATLVNKRVLQQDQVDLLLPPNDNKTDSSKFDVTLIVILIINFTTLTPPLNGWKDKNPPAHDRSKGAGVILGRKWRNFVHHSEPKDIDEAKFNQKWAEGTQIINDLGYHYDTTKLKTISLDSKYEIVFKFLYSFIKRLDTKFDALEAKQDSLRAKRDSSLTRQLSKITNEVQHLRSEKERRKEPDTSSTGSRCLKSVLEYISKEIKEEEAEELLSQLNIQAEGDFVDKLKYVPWKNIKRELEMLKRKDIVEHIRRNTLITRGLQTASENLHDHYKIELIKCLVQQPLSSVTLDSQYASREDTYIDLVVLPSSTVDKEYDNSDRASLMKQKLLDKSSTEKAVDKIIQPEDELVFMRGVAGIGKTTLIDIFTLKWAKNELDNSSIFEFVFKLTCREMNQILDEFKTLEELLKLKYPNIFDNITLTDLTDISERVLIIVDGLDELKDIYQMDGMNKSSASKARFLQVVFDMINPKSMTSLANHKTIVCGRPKACEFVKSQISKLSKIKTIEICGFNHLNVQKYILNFFGKNQTKAKLVESIITSSYNLKVMSTVPVFLWVICNVYMEDLIKNRINTNTELYFYTCLVFIRNHYQGTSRNYENLLDVISDQDIVNGVYSLMVLSAKTYMQNQVLFTDEDITQLKCPIHLEQTGFIVKYCESNTVKSIFQFRHLILQEFLCGMYLCVTKGLSPFMSNRELSSCLPTIYGIHRIIQDGKNEFFLHFFNALQKSNERFSSTFAKFFTPFKSLSYNMFIWKHIPSKLELPPSMIKDRTLYITDEPECREFLDVFKESNDDIDAPLIFYVVIELLIYKDYKNILNLLEKLNIAKIDQFEIISTDIFYANGNIDENILRLYEMTGGSPNRTNIKLSSSNIENTIFCTSEEVFLYVLPPLRVINILNSLEKLHITKIHKFNIQSKYLFGENGNLDGNILRLYEMTIGLSMETSIKFSSYIDDNQIICTSEKFLLGLHPSSLRVIDILNVLDKLHITNLREFDMKPKDLFDGSGSMDEDILQLYKMTAGSSMETDIQFSYNDIDNNIKCTARKLTLSLHPPLTVINILNVLEKFDITNIHKIDIESKNLLDESGNMDGNILRLFELTTGSLLRTDIKLLSHRNSCRIEYTGGELVITLHSAALLSLPEVIKTTTKIFQIYLHQGVLRHGTVQGFVQEITKYAVKHCKLIRFFSSSSNTYSSVKTLLKEAGIGVNNSYVRFFK